jgi:hypothetical protein
MKFEFALFVLEPFVAASHPATSNKSRTSPYINHLMEKLMHTTVDIATNSSVGMDDSILVGDDKSHFDR